MNFRKNLQILRKMTYMAVNGIKVKFIDIYIAIE